MQIKQAKMDDLNQIMEILRDGRNQLAEQGIDQWQGDYPNEEHIKEDIEKGFAYLVQSQDDELLVHYQLLKHQITHMMNLTVIG